MIFVIIDVEIKLLFLFCLWFWLRRLHVWIR